MTKNNVIIRPFISFDYQAVIELLTNAFRDDFYQIIKVEKKKIKSLIRDLKLVDHVSNHGHFVAVHNDKIVGLISLKWQQQEGRNHRELDYHKIYKRHGLIKPLKMSLAMSLLSKEVNQSECYIETIAVAPNYQGQGIGNLMLMKAVEVAKKLPSVHSLSLMVSMNNHRALDFFQIHGFKTKAIESNPLSGLLFGKKEWLYMIKSFT